jgi:hypothetical protein
LIREWQATYENFARLKILPFLYKRYRQYEYILFYEADAFVFRDELSGWCDKGYDYIGAPWFEGFGKAELDAPLAGVGNGGFSLRKVDSALRALRSFSYIKRPRSVLSILQDKRYPFKEKLLRVWHSFLNATVRNNTFAPFNTYSGGEDLFWGRFVSKNFKWFRVAPIEEAAHFSFEVHPRRMIEITEGKLPFGCHAWWRYDLDFLETADRSGGIRPGRHSRTGKNEYNKA